MTSKSSVHEGRVQNVFDDRYLALAIKTDRLFGYLFIFQWLLGIAFAYWISPLTWAGGSSRTHFHVYIAVFLGGLVAAYPVYLVFSNPGSRYNRLVVATAQMLFSILFIHLTGGRIETHFHIFGSLAFLAFYRDLRVIVLATAITATDHFLRGIFWPESIYGILLATPWRAFEHAAWVLFEDFILFYSIQLALGELRSASESQVKLEENLQSIEEQVARRTQELSESKRVILEQQQNLVSSAKLSSLGEMAGGIAHEINTPLAIISMRVEQLEESLEEGDSSPSEVRETLKVVKDTTERISKIVSGLRFFARDGSATPAQSARVAALIDDTLSFCCERFASHGVRLEIEKNSDYHSLQLECRAVEISQVLLNLLNNAFDAIQKLDEKWIRVDVKDIGDHLQIGVTDSGNGIPAILQEKIMEPFFTTKEVGKGTGLGLSISRGVILSHKGKFEIDNSSSNTRFVLTIPKVQPVQMTGEAA